MIVKTYRAKAAGWIAGRRVAAGEEIRLTAAEAKYEPVELAVAEAASVAKGATATAKPARKAKAAAKPAAGDVEPVPATAPVTTPEADPA
ncbi:hypothetical protein [Cereibacter changlensis]|uniref:hypothetical protein n=1 Tax=Cereibacter changlensis TaxID=402884 RepID=UPI00403441BF